MKIYYKVKSGDSLGEIAEKFRTSVNKIKDLEKYEFSVKEINSLILLPNPDFTQFSREMRIS